MSSQLNIKLDPKLKKDAEKVAHELGFSVSSVTRAFLLNFVRTRKVYFALDEVDTSASLTGENLEQAMIQTGYDKKYAKQHKQAYNQMRQAEKGQKLTEW